MKKRLSFLVLAFMAVLAASAQMIAYQVMTHVQGQPGTPTVIDLQGTTGTDLSGLVIDADGNLEFNDVEEAKCFPIGFDFGYNGQQMKYFLIGSDLEVQLSTTETASTKVNTNKMSWFTTSGIHDVIGMAPRYGVYGLDDTQISYWTEGEAGFRALVIEYKNVDFGNGGGWGTENEYCGAKATVQYRLYESGNIEMKVTGFQPLDPGNYNFFRIGILGDSNDFVQIQSWDGSVISARDNTISYKKDQYPVNGQVYTFVAPEPCQTPATAPANLVLTSTTTAVSGKFTAGSCDHYLVVALPAGADVTAPVDQTKYTVGSELGEGKVIAIVEGIEFSFNGLEPATNYSIYVYGFNSLCMNGPLYNATPATATIATKPGAPKALTVGNVDKTTMSVSVTPDGTTPVIVAMTTEQEINMAQQYLPNGVFGIPTGTYQVGDEIEGGGKIVFVGTPAEAINLTDLAAGTPYFFRAWSSDGQGGYSSEYLDANDVTASELPWQLTIDETLIVGDDYLGWTSDHGEDAYWTDNSSNGYIYNQINYVDETEGTITWYESPYIYLAEGNNRIKTSIAGTKRAGWMQSAWTLADGECIKFQVTKDGVEYKDILTIDKNNCESLSDASFVPFEAAFSDYAGEKVRLRIYIHRFSMGQTQFSRIYLEEKPAVDYPANISVASVDGGNVTIQWDAQEGAVSYDVSYKLASEEEWGEPQNVSATSIALTGLQGLSSYQARVRTNGASATSGWSDAMSFMTGASVPFEFVVKEAEDLFVWSTYAGELSENTELSEGGDIAIVQRSGFGGVQKHIQFMPYGATSNSWLVSPSVSLGNDAYSKFVATLTLTTVYKGDPITLKVVVANDGENFSSANVIGTIEMADLPESEESQSYNFDIEGFSGSIRLGFYVEGSGSDMTWIEFDKMGIKADTSTSLSSVKAVTAPQAVYNLSGQRLDQPRKGMMIIDGKKQIVK